MSVSPFSTSDARLGVSIAEAVAVQSSRPPLPIFSFDDVSTSLELDIERKIVASILSVVTWPTRSKIAGVRIEQAELRVAEDTLRIAAETRKAYIRAVAAREILATLNASKANADATAALTEQLTATGAVNKLDHARAQVFASELEAQVTSAGLQATAAQEQLTRLMGLWGTDLDRLLPRTLPPLPAKSITLAAVERDAMDRRVDLAVDARSEARQA